MKRFLFALAVVLALFSACSSDSEPEGEELIGSRVEPEPVLGAGQGATIFPFAYRFTGTDMQIDITGQYSRNTGILTLSIKFSGMDEHEINMQLTQYDTEVGDSFYFGDGQILYKVNFSPPGFIYGYRYHGNLFFSCLILDASSAKKGFAYGTIDNIDPL